MVDIHHMNDSFYGQHGEDFLLWHVLHQTHQGFFVDVGAFDGRYLSNSFYFEKHGWHGICVEPHPTYFPLCNANRPQSICIHAACVGNPELAEIDFYTEPSGLYSGVQANRDAIVEMHYQYTFGKTFDGLEKHRVPAYTLNALLEKYLPDQTPIDFISIDVEGTELDVLAGLDLDRFSPRILLIETNDDVCRQKTDDYLKQWGYITARSLNVNTFYVRDVRMGRALSLLEIYCRRARVTHPLGKTYTEVPFLEGDLYNEKQDLWQRLADSEADRAERLKFIYSQQSELSRLRQELETWQARGATAEHALNDAEATLQTRHAELETWQARAATAEHALHDAEATLQTRHAELEATLQAHHTELETWQARAAIAEHALHDAEATLQTRHAELETWQARAATAEHAHAEVQSLNDRYQQQLDEIQSQYETTHEQLRQVRVQYIFVKNHHDDLRQQLDMTSAQLQQTISQLADTQQRAQMYQAQWEEAQHLLKKLEAKLQLKSDVIQHQEVRLQTIKQALEDKIQQREANLAHLRLEQQRLTQNMATVTQTELEQQQVITLQAAHLADIRTSLEQLEQRHNELRLRLHQSEEMRIHQMNLLRGFETTEGVLGRLIRIQAQRFGVYRFVKHYESGLRRFYYGLRKFLGRRQLPPTEVLQVEKTKFAEAAAVTPQLPESRTHNPSNQQLTLTFDNRQQATDGKKHHQAVTRRLTDDHPKYETAHYFATARTLDTHRSDNDLLAIEQIQYIRSQVILIYPSLADIQVALMLASGGTNITLLSDAPLPSLAHLPQLAVIEATLGAWLASSVHNALSAYNAVWIGQTHATDVLSQLAGWLLPQHQLVLADNLDLLNGVATDMRFAGYRILDRPPLYLLDFTTHQERKTLPSGNVFPKISIVTVTYNQAQFIEATIQSVLEQQYPNLEYIIVDGNSTDNTAEIVQRYQEQITHYIREPDAGQSDALNKGFALATGDILAWLNSDDRYLPGTLQHVAHTFDTYASDVVAGGCALVYNDDVTPARVHHSYFPYYTVQPLPLKRLLDIDNAWLTGDFFYQPEVFWTRNIWERSGANVNTALHYCMDYDLWVRMAQNAASIVHIPATLCLFRLHPQQKTHGDELPYLPELREIQARVLSRAEQR